MSTAALTVETFATMGIQPSTAALLVLWYSSTNLDNSDLFKAQVTSLGKKIQQRLSHDVEANASGIIVDTNGAIDGEGYNMILHTIDALDIDVVLIMGHDRLYSMLSTSFDKEQCTIIKLPRSGGLVSRDSAFRRKVKSLAVKRYFYGTTHQKVSQLTPYAMQVPFKEVTLYQLSSVALSNSLLPVGQQQSSENVQLTPVTISEGLVHHVLCVCHPAAVALYTESGKASDLYESAVAGFVVVEKVSMDTDVLHVLSPCAGALPSLVFLVGDITFME
jgi:polyribonucleotide 5'-hydroxyl-kinase